MDLVHFLNEKSEFSSKVCISFWDPFAFFYIFHAFGTLVKMESLIRNFSHSVEGLNYTI